jgi:CHAT domain-containing protein/tetratricopeptide (TPR) repeat protein
MSRFVIVCPILGLVFLFLPAVAVAQPSAQELARAEQLFATAPALFKNGQHAQAIQVTQQVVDIRMRELGADHGLTVATVSFLGRLHLESGDAVSAEPLFRKTVAQYAKVLGEENETTLRTLALLGRCCYERENFAESESMYRKCVELCGKVLGERHPETLQHMQMLWYTQFSLGKAQESIATQKKHLDLVRAELGGEHPNVAQFANSLGDACFLLNDFAQAEALYREALDIRKKSLNGDHDDTLESLADLGRTLTAERKFEEAERICRQHLEVVKQSRGADSAETAISLRNLGRLYSEMKRHALAKQQLAEVLKLQTKHFGESSPSVVAALAELAMEHQALAEYPEAEALFQQALTMAETLQDPRLVESTCSNFAVLCQEMGKLSQSVSLLQRSITISSAVAGKDSTSTATNKANLAMLYVEMGRFELASDLMRESLEVLKESPGTSDAGVLRVMNNHGLMAQNLGDFHGAKKIHEECLQLRQNHLGENHPDVAMSLVNLSDVYFRLSDLPRATDAVTNAMRIFRVAYGPEHPDTIKAINSFGTLLSMNGLSEDAVPILEEAYALQVKVLGETHPSTVSTEHNLAGAYADLGRTDVAEKHYRNAIQKTKASDGAQAPSLISMLGMLAKHYECVEKSKEALALLDESRRISQQHVTHVLPALADRQQLMFLRNSDSPQFFHALSLVNAHQDDPAMVAAAVEWLINGKSVAQEALSQQTRVERLDQIKHTRGWINSAKIRQAIPEGAVFVDVVRFEEVNFRSRSIADSWKPGRYVACLSFAENGPDCEFIDLGLADAIDSLVREIREETQAAALKGGSIVVNGEDEATKALKEKLKRLAAIVWQPIETRLNNVQAIILSPDGALWLTPWAALPVGDDEFLIERYSVQYVISGRSLIAEKSNMATTGPAILANPLFDQDAGEKQASIEAMFKVLPEPDEISTRSFTAKTLLPSASPLPNTAIEAAAIQPNLEKYAGQKATLYQQRYALERVAKALKSPSVVSFATHGFFLPTQPVATDGPQHISSTASLRSANLTSDGQPVENPLLRCGLLLAGCNNRDTIVGDDDGILTGLEIVGIDLRGTELVVLSACETGIGDVRNGEGVAGLRQAFQLAGADAVVSTLWQVPDRDSALLMSKFFEELANGKSKSEALRSAQLERIQKRRDRYGAAHPFFWAAFTLTGE